MARRLGLICGLALGCLVGFQGRALGREFSRFWVSHEPGPQTVVLLHFDGDLKDASANQSGASADGAVELVKDGRFGGGLRLNGAVLRSRSSGP